MQFIYVPYHNGATSTINSSTKIGRYLKDMTNTDSVAERAGLTIYANDQRNRILAGFRPATAAADPHADN